MALTLLRDPIRMERLASFVGEHQIVPDIPVSLDHPLNRLPVAMLRERLHRWNYERT